MYKAIFMAAILSMVPLVPASAATCHWHKALANIKAALDHNKGAKACFAKEYECQLRPDPKRGGMFVRTGGCKSGLDALLYCQRHNKRAQESIKQCAGKTKAYLKSRGYKR